MSEKNLVRFFVPAARSDEESLAVWNGTRRFVMDTLGWSVTDRRVYSVDYLHDGDEVSATVGELEPRVGEPVVAILETDQCWLVCTPTRGVVRGSPILIGLPIRVVDFANR